MFFETRSGNPLAAGGIERKTMPTLQTREHTHKLYGPRHASRQHSRIDRKTKQPTRNGGQAGVHGAFTELDATYSQRLYKTIIAVSLLESDEAS